MSCILGPTNSCELVVAHVVVALVDQLESVTIIFLLDEEVAHPKVQCNPVFILELLLISKPTDDCTLKWHTQRCSVMQSLLHKLNSVVNPDHCLLCCVLVTVMWLDE